MTNHMKPFPEKDLRNMPLENIQQALLGMTQTIERKQAKLKECQEGLEALKQGMPRFVPNMEPQMTREEVTHPISIWEGMTLLELQDQVKILSTQWWEELKEFKLKADYYYDDFEGLRFTREGSRLETPEEVKRRNQLESTRHYAREGRKIEAEEERLQGIISVLNRQIPQIGANIEALKAEIQFRGEA